jgi:hypothetical protein
MGTLRSMTDHSGMVVNGITLGEPARDMDDNDEPVGEYRWDDSRLPNGVISDSGEITVDEEDE